ncbi:MAG TPA: hypothetical protein VIV12_23840, partial [Streptosporangiaceae bacterium]
PRWFGWRRLAVSGRVLLRGRLGRGFAVFGRLGAQPRAARCSDVLFGQFGCGDGPARRAA